MKSSTGDTRATNGASRGRVVMLGILTSIAVLLAIFRLRPGAAHSDQGPASSSAMGVPDSESNHSTAGESDTTPVPIEVTWPIELRRDLFAGAEEPQPPRPAPTVDVAAIRRDAAKNLKLVALIQGTPPRAVINGEPATEGDLLQGFRVLRITRDGVVVMKQGVTVELKL
jgi:hypothetical protein